MPDQYYASECKDEVLARLKKSVKADVTALVFATQLFAPSCNLVGDGFGRPSHLASAPDPIKVIDPAYGSARILMYALRLLAALREEAGRGLLPTVSAPWRPACSPTG